LDREGNHGRVALTELEIAVVGGEQAIGTAGFGAGGVEGVKGTESEAHKVSAR